MKNEKETKNPGVNAGYAAKEVKNLDRTENKENNMLVDAESAYANAVKSETEKLAKDFSDMKNKANLKRAHK